MSRRRPAQTSQIGIAIFVCALTTNTFAQRLDFRTFANTGRLPSGLQIDSLSLNGDYFNLYAPQNELPTDGSSPIGSVFGGGAGVSMGWYLRGSRTDLEVHYNGHYEEYTRYPQLRGLDQEVSLILRRKVTPKLELDFYVNGQSTKVSELLLAPSGLLTVAQSANTPAELQGMSSTGAPVEAGVNPSLIAATDAPFLFAVSGARLYTGSAGASFLYSVNPKLLWFTHTQANRLWYRQDQTSAGEGLWAIPPYGNLGATSGLVYLVGKRMQLESNVNYERSQSKYHEANAASLALSLTRYLGHSWFISGGGGPGIVKLKNVGGPGTQTDGYNASGTIGYKGLAHTVMLVGQRSVSGRFGLGEDHTESGTLVWSWQERGSPWTVSSRIGYERLNGGSIRHLDAWVVSISATQRLTQRTNIVAEFVDSNNSAPTVGALNGITRRAARIALVWTPSPKGAYRRWQ